MKLDGLSESHPTRLEIKETVRHRGPMSVRQIAEDIGADSISQCAYHVRVLEQQGALRQFERDSEVLFEAT